MAILCLISIIFGILNGSAEALSSSVLDGAKNAVEFCFKISSTICFFCGLMKVAEKAGITAFIAKCLRPVIRIIMPLAAKDKKTEEAVSMNISSNLLGLGNAATPFGIEASRLLYNKRGISRSLAAFIIINTAPLQLIPSTVIALRQSNGAISPADIIPQVLLTQLASCIFGVLLVVVFFKKEDGLK